MTRRRGTRRGARPQTEAVQVPASSPGPKAAAPCGHFLQHAICILVCERCLWPLADHAKTVER